MKTYFLLPFVLLAFCSQYSFAQGQRGLGGDIGLYLNSNQNIGFHYAVNYHWMLNKYIGTSVGAMFFHTKLDSPGWYGENQKTFYSLDNDKVKHLNVTSSVFALCPMIKSTGLYSHTSFFFEPVPIDNISLNKTTFSTQGKQYETFDKTQYSRFSPGIFTEIGIYHEFKREGNSLKLFLGFGYGWYDIYSAFNRCTIDKQRLSEHVPTDKNYYKISIRIL
jgi:hypothetical protein